MLVFLFLFALFSDEPEVFLPKYSQTAILRAAHFRRVVKSEIPYRLKPIRMNNLNARGNGRMCSLRGRGLLQHCLSILFI